MKGKIIPGRPDKRKEIILLGGVGGEKHLEEAWEGKVISERVDKGKKFCLKRKRKSMKRKKDVEKKW